MADQLAVLIGNALKSIAYDAECHQWVLRFRRGGSIRAACAWRLISNSQIVLGWRDDGQPFGLPEPLDAAVRARSALAGTLVSDTRTDAMTGDLHLVFDNGCELQLFNDSCGYEGWTADVDGLSIIALGGGGITSFSPDTSS